MGKAVQSQAGWPGTILGFSECIGQISQLDKIPLLTKKTTMKIEIQGYQLEFIKIPIKFHKNIIIDLFAQKNNKTLAETLSNKRYASLSSEVIRRYPGSLNVSLGDFLYNLKMNHETFFLRFLNEHGDKVFCDFSVPSTPVTKLKGLYCFTIDDAITYIGRSHDPFEKRLNLGYGHISPKNCYLDGQSTNCHINSIIAQYPDSGVSFHVCPLDEDLKIDRLEKLLINDLKPEWNILLKRTRVNQNA